MPSENQHLADLPASIIPVSLFRKILIWPLALHLPRPAAHAFAVAEAVDEAAATICSKGGASAWQLVDDPTEHIEPPTDPPELAQWTADRYAEGSLSSRICSELSV